jgi:hypothetical protein
MMPHVLTPRLRSRRPAARPATRRLRPAVVALEDRALLTIAVDLRYDFDSAGFFAAPDRRALLQQAVTSLAATLTDHLAAIAPAASNSWSAVFSNPSTGQTQSVPNLLVPADTLILYVGGRDLPGSTAGFGGAGGFSASGSQAWLDTVRARGQTGALAAVPSDFGPWGGSISFDTAGTNFYFGQDAAGIGGGQIDFLSVAMHEFGHVLGIGNVPSSGLSSWSRFISGGVFTGPNAVAANGGASVPLDAVGTHWADGTRSDGIIAAMTPTLFGGVRHPFTSLDYAGLRDAGWVVQPPLGTGSLQLSASTATTVEGGGAVTLTVTRTGGSSGTVTVQYATSDGTARAGSDYAATAGTLSFAPGQTSQTISIPILNDGSAEGLESFNLTLSAAAGGGSLGTPSTAVVTVTDDDTAGVVVTQSGGSTAVAEGRATDSYTLALTTRPSSNVTITLVPDTQVVGTPGSLTFTPQDWNVPRTITVSAVDDRRVEGAHTGSIAHRATSADPGYNGIAIASVTVQITDNDRAVATDSDGDGKTDIAVYGYGRYAINPTSGGSTFFFGFGGADDRPLAGDYDGDGKTDIAVYGYGRFAYNPSSGGPTVFFGFGGPDDRPVVGDYDGDGKTDIAVYGYGRFAYIPSSGGPTVFFGFGGPDDRPVTGDYDGDGKTDIAVYGYGRFAYNPSGGGPTVFFGFGGPEDRPVAGDYDGDGKTDVAVYGYGRFAYIPSRGGSTVFFGFGGPDDRPVIGDYDGDGKTDIAVYGYGRFAYNPSSGGPTQFFGFGGPEDVPLNLAAFFQRPVVRSFQALSLLSAPSVAGTSRTSGAASLEFGQQALMLSVASGRTIDTAPSALADLLSLLSPSLRRKPESPAPRRGHFSPSPGRRGDRIVHEMPG